MSTRSESYARNIVNKDVDQHDSWNADIVSRLQADDTSVLLDVSEQYATDIYAIAHSITGRSDLAQDIVQDVLVKLWDQRSELSRVYDISGFLRRIARHRSIDVLRHEQAQERLAEQVARRGEVTNRYHVNPGQSNVESADVRAIVFSVLETIPARCREIFLMHWEGELSYAEIAETLGITSGTVRTQIYRAMKALSVYFADHPL